MHSVQKVLRAFYKQDVQRYKEGVALPPLIKLLKSSDLDRATLARLMTLRCELACFFEDKLRLIMKVVEKSDLSSKSKRTLIKSAEKNLKEELGQIPKYGRAHREDRALFLKEALGLDYDDWSKDFGTYENLGAVHLATKFIINNVRSLIGLGPIEAIAVLWYWEHRLSRGGYGEFFIFLEAFERKFPEFKKDSYEEGDALYWIASHAEHDTDHAKLAADALELSNSKEKGVKSVSNIIELMDSFFEIYYEMLLRY